MTHSLSRSRTARPSAGSSGPFVVAIEGGWLACDALAGTLAPRPVR